ncbi:Uncharacterized conserved protein, DUF2147 family [Rhizobium sp. NFR07]|uniref:DUF2147 domain-containing protein n=1 Tax=Rhizobium sp. NFR07 TaxID=1566262 RepID=UPI0008E9B10E|nr:DUF2147 domain-containing protein [Rhizobium sp. NFR07]SFB58684.1 Uncharacterized conserved protein, DUF2147 family [Rhizobium sp. NFR07]
MGKTLAATAVFLMSAISVLAAEPIEGSWKTQSGATAEIGKCGSAYCVTLTTGKHAGKQIGRMSGSGDSYSGEITDPETDKTYSGSGAVTGNALKMKGCVLKVLCKSQTWTRL